MTELTFTSVTSLALIRYGKDWLLPCQDNVTDQVIVMAVYISQVGQHYEVTLCAHCHSKTSLNRPNMGATFNGPFREVVGLGN